MNEIKHPGNGLFSQIRYLRWVLITLFMSVLALFLVVGLLSRALENITLSLLLHNAVISAELPVISGLVPQIQIVLWSASLAICILMWLVLRQRRDEYAGSKQVFLQFGIITFVLLLDDMFLFHGEIAPKILHIDKHWVFAAYLIMIVYFLYSNRGEILSSEYLLLMLALVLFSGSVFFDSLPIQYFNFHRLVDQFRFFLEDGLRFAGVAVWLTYISRYALRRIEPARGNLA